ncbi:Deoxycytidylate deaminase [Cyphellophora attinorum]|uniref:Deoxycytidylate deaminase n=1 Tax=Cyphellophora attinorum TaxID=1664694 RepID=A0A0N1HP40_9EURO|nr:Deoxycytidylate deaminase [Phialophora attinorum]KPI39427.1 Deoxycytidylate deaminase [Phialophora attinorum]
MLIGICGSICSGKHITAEYLVQHHGFLRLHLPSDAQLLSNTPEDAKRLLPSVTDQKGTRGLTFPDVDSLLDFVTKRWREHWVLTDIHDETTLELLLRRPFFLLLSIDAPVSLRYQRFTNRCTTRHLDPMPLLDFITTNDIQLYGSLNSSAPTTPGVDGRPSHNPGIAHLLPRAHLQILNQYTSIPSYYTFLSSLELPSPIRLRPTWDAYFMTLASLASLRSNCMKRRVGCVLVSNSRIISTGYNGTPRNLTNCNEGGCERCNNTGRAGGVGLSTCLCLHAEENALLEAGRERIREGSVLYCDTCPCLTCSVKIAQVGVKEVVYSQSYNMDEASRAVLKEAGVELRQFSPPRSGLVGMGTSYQAGWEDLGGELVVR